MTQEANSDELATFVASTLRAIALGVTEGQDNKISSAHGTGVFGFAAPKNIEFDIAVTAKVTGSADGGLKIAVFGIGANAGANTASENSTVSRIKFAVPTMFKEDRQPIPAPPSNKTAWTTR